MAGKLVSYSRMQNFLHEEHVSVKIQATSNAGPPRGEGEGKLRHFVFGSVLLGVPDRDLKLMYQ